MNNRSRLLDLLRKSKKFDENGFLFLRGPVTQAIFDDDTEYLLSPENLFMFLFGINEPNTYGMIQMNSGKTTILVD